MPSHPRMFLIGRVTLSNGRRVQHNINVVAYDATITCTDYLSLSPLKQIQGYFEHIMVSDEPPHPDGLYHINAKVNPFTLH